MTVYSTKVSSEVSWTQTVPIASLDFIRSFNLPKHARIIEFFISLIDHQDL